MKKNRRLVASILLSAACLATSLPPFAGECRLVDRIFAATKDEATRSLGLELLEHIGTDRTGSRDYELMSAIGIKFPDGQHGAFDQPIVRARALERLGETGLKEAVDFLAALKASDLGPDSTPEVWPAAQVALQRSLLARISDSQLRVEFLETTLQRGGGVVGSWAVNELCNGGVKSSLPAIRNSIHKSNPFPDGDAERAFCDARIQLLSRDPDRVKALASALHVDNHPPDLKLLHWAVFQLVSLASPEAHRELDRFSREISALPDGSVVRMSFDTLREEIDAARREGGIR